MEIPVAVVLVRRRVPTDLALAVDDLSRIMQFWHRLFSNFHAEYFPLGKSHLIREQGAKSC